MPEWMKLPPRLPGAVRAFVGALSTERPGAVDTFQALFEGSPLPLVITDATTGEILDVNGVAEALSQVVAEYLKKQAEVAQRPVSRSRKRRS